MKLQKSNGYTVIVIGDKSTSALGKTLEGKFHYIDKDADQQTVTELLGKELDGVPFPVAVVSRGEGDGIVGVVSAIGESVIVHCPDMIIPLKGILPSGKDEGRVIEKRERFQL